jgi:4-hydroxy-L-threonine phosphate dehydrogenase PdxA
MATETASRLDPLAIACGDPAGVGPYVSALAALDVARRGERVRLFGDRVQLDGLLGGATERALIEVDDVGRVDPACVRSHAPSAEGGAAALAALDAAADAVARGACRGLVTAPVSKSAIRLGGTAFVGQTEHLAVRAGLAHDGVTMMFLGPRLKVALATTHLRLRDVPDALTAARVGRSIRHLGDALLRLGVPRGARLVVSGLNPHAGEDGLFGDEEPRVVGKAIAWARTFEPFASGRLEVVGPVGAETALRDAKDQRAAGVVAMFHDQATIASKLLDWGAAVNVTWGLPYVRTSVDHGVAWDAAARGDADAGGMIAAARLAEALTRPATAGAAT